MSRENIYLDYSSTTPVDPGVVEAMHPYFFDQFGNASSVHTQGRKGKVALETAREIIADEIEALPAEILFTSGGTESNNTAIIGVAHSMHKRGKDHVITSKAEHQAVLEPSEYLESHGFKVTYLNVNRYGMVTEDELKQAITPGTGLVSLMHVNNELGTLNDILRLGEICRERGVLFHTDAVQSFVKLPVSAREIPFDLLSASAHKIYGPKGIGLLYIRKGVEFERFHHGGGQERGRRGGTENVPLAVGFSKGVELMNKIRRQENERAVRLRERLLDLLKKKLPALQVNTDLDNSLPQMLNISFDSREVVVDGEALLMGLDTAGLSVSNGSACTSGSLVPSHVQLAIGKDKKTAMSAIRFSTGKYTTDKEIDAAADILTVVVNKIARPAAVA